MVYCDLLMGPMHEQKENKHDCYHTITTLYLSTCVQTKMLAELTYTNKVVKQAKNNTITINQTKRMLKRLSFAVVVCYVLTLYTLYGL